MDAFLPVVNLARRVKLEIESTLVKVLSSYARRTAVNLQQEVDWRITERFERG